MKHLNFSILFATLGLVLGIALVDGVQIPLHLVTVAGLLLFAALILLHFGIQKIRKLRVIFTVLSVLFFIALGYYLHKTTLPENSPTHYIHLTRDTDQTISLEITDVLKPTTYQNKYVGTLISLDNKPVSGDTLINVNKDSLATSRYSVGDLLYIRTVVQAVPQPKNPYQFDYGRYLKRKAIYGQVSISADVVLRSKTSGGGIKVAVASFRESVQNKLSSYPFTQDQLAVLNALVLGQKQGIDREMSEQYAAAGMMHILAVSGLHVGIVLLLLRLLTKPISGYRLRFVRSGIIIVLIWLFAILTGLSPSVLRAATMFSFLEASTLIGTKKETPNALIASAFVLLLLDPLLIYQVGFQLSYAAVIAILWIQPWLSSLLKIKNKLLKMLWDTAAVTTAAQLGVMPLSLFYFHQFPGLFLVSNLVIIPLLGLLLGVGIVVVILAGIGHLPDWLVLSFGKVIDTLNGFIAWVASKEAFVLKYISISLLVMIATYFLIITVVALLKKYSYGRMILAGLSLLLFITCLGYQTTSENKAQLVVFHKNRQTLLAKIVQKELHLQTEDTTWDYTTDSRIIALRNATGIGSIQVTALDNVIRFKNNNILVVDSLGVYNLKKFTPDYILLTLSPTINLERLIDRYPKARLIADGNNYKSAVLRWQATCLKRKIPFHSTYEKGAFMID